MTAFVEPLVVRRIIRAPPEMLFDAWTRPERLTAWWGPAGVTCPEADVDLRVGGAYRIANAFPDGHVVIISGVFEMIEKPRLLVFSWVIDGGEHPPERVSVHFDSLDGGSGTEVIVRHQRVMSREARESHEAGWIGCLDGLGRYLI